MSGSQLIYYSFFLEPAGATAPFGSQVALSLYGELIVVLLGEKKKKKKEDHRLGVIDYLLLGSLIFRQKYCFCF